MRRYIFFILILLINCDLPFNNQDGLEYFKTKEPLEGYCYIHDRHFVADWFIAVDDSGNVIEDTTNYAELSNETISLKIFTDDIITFSEKYQGYRLLLKTNSEKVLKLKSQDGRIYLFQEAKNFDGKWKAIEKLTPSFCGNSYYSVVLNPNDTCEFSIPIYRGEFITKIRFKLLIDANNYILSDEFVASINSSQFVDQPFGFNVLEADKNLK
jgi:hypothetical protein